MTKTALKFLFLLSVGLFAWIPEGNTQPYTSDGHVKVAMRMIGHEMLLLSGDSTSRVLPISKSGDRYKIEFESEFEFVPEQLVAVIQKVIDKSKVVPRYLVEIEECKTHEVVYSYEIDITNKSDIIPCVKRSQPKNCYALYFTLLEPKEREKANSFDVSNVSGSTAAGQPSKPGFNKIWLTIAILVLLGAFIWMWRFKLRAKTGPEIIRIGEYRFDKLNMQLTFKNKTTELSSKEADLLFLLYTSANTTLERDSILREVWGDDGDYVGRTMDVFISKLRKKLADDSNLKIVNIRGVGYKFVVNR